VLNSERICGGRWH